eukprot:3727493-Rhodomonas_salina.1
MRGIELCERERESGSEGVRGELKTGRDRKTQRGRWRERQRERWRERWRDRQTEKKSDRQADRDRQTGTDRGRGQRQRQKTQHEIQQHRMRAQEKDRAAGTHTIAAGEILVHTSAHGKVRRTHALQVQDATVRDEL